MRQVWDRFDLLGLWGKDSRVENLESWNGARCRVRTCDPYRVKVMLYR